MGGALGSATGAGRTGRASGAGATVEGVGLAGAGTGAGAGAATAALFEVGLTGAFELTAIADSGFSVGPAVQALRGAVLAPRRKRKRRCFEDAFTVHSAPYRFSVLRRPNAPVGTLGFDPRFVQRTVRRREARVQSLRRPRP
jgi:hypothetical protein